MRTVVQFAINVTVFKLLKMNSIYPVANPEILSVKKGRVLPDLILLKDGATVNPGAIITAGVTIGKNSIIGVGSIVSKDVPDYSVVAGNPARVVRKIEH